MPAQNKKFILPLVLVGMLAGLAVIVSTMGGGLAPPAGDKPPPKPPTVTVEQATAQWDAIVRHAAAPPRGNPSARYSVVEFGDFQCPQCGKVRPLLEATMNKAGGNANLYFVHRPFPTIHKFAIAAAQASYEAAAEGKFWPMYDELYSHQDDLEPGNYDEYARNVGVDPKKALEATRDLKYARKVQEVSAFCNKLPINQTPTLVVRDNSTGKVIAVPSGKVEIEAYFAAPPWATSTATAARK